MVITIPLVLVRSVMQKKKNMKANGESLLQDTKLAVIKKVNSLCMLRIQRPWLSSFSEEIKNHTK